MQGAGRVEASGSWRGGDCAGGVVIAPIAPAGQRLRPVRGERKQGVGRTEARRRQGAGRAEAS